MGSWAGDEEHVTTPAEIQAWVARTIWWQGRLDLLRVARQSLQPPPTTVDAPVPVVERVRPPLRPRGAPAVEA